jgi:hypothetical protein
LPYTVGTLGIVAVSVQAKADVASRPFCAAVSSASEEPLAATASRIDHWILVEYRGRWTRDVLGGSLLSPALKEHLRQQLAALPHARLLFVKKPENRAQSPRNVFFGGSRPGQERLFRLEVADHEDLLGFDFAAALGADGTPGVRVDDPLLVVCTHGKRDRCCARHGRPLYDGLRHETESSSVWQATHVGGDRFAGNVVVLPHGLYYGRVGPDDGPALLAAQASGWIDLDRYRGRSTYSFPVQAAEHAIRESEGLLGIDDLVFLGSEPIGDHEWRVRFRGPGSAVHEVGVVASLAEEPVYLTCGSAEPQRARRHEVTSHRVLSS